MIVNTRGLKSYIWKELCTNEYTKRADAMRDAEKSGVRAQSNQALKRHVKPGASAVRQGPVPMDIGNVQIHTVKLNKLTPAEREKCMKEVLCLTLPRKGDIWPRTGQKAGGTEY